MTIEHRMRKPAIALVGFCLFITLPVNADTQQAAESQPSNTLAIEQSATERIDSQTFRADSWVGATLNSGQ